MAKRLIKVFISYAPADAAVVEVFKNGIHQHLPLSTRFKFEIGDPAELLGGDSVKTEIANRLASCDVAILCISASFLNLDSIAMKELAALLKQGNKKVVIPVYLKQCFFQAWETECGIDVYKPSGVNYNKGSDESFAFCDLVTVTETEGRLTTIADKYIDRYFMDLAQQLELVLSGGKTEIMAAKAMVPEAKTEYINEINYPYFDDTNFFGREIFLSQINDKINSLKLPLLVSGIGGMGKTTTAIAYGQLPAYAANFQYIGWVNVTGDLFNSLFSTFKGNAILPFEYDPGGNQEKDRAAFMQLLKNTSGNNLLIIDNVNNEADIDVFINNWMQYKPGWKCIITTRINNKSYQDHMLSLQSLTPEEAEQLFLKHNPSDDFDQDYFLNLYHFTGGHTFVIELLAKYAESSSTIKNTKQLLEYLSSKGIKALTLAVKAKQGQQQQADRKVSDFLYGLYEPLRLPEKEQEYIRYFSVLPPSEIDFEKLVYLCGIKEEDIDTFDTTLRTMAKAGWLTCTKKGFFLQQMIGQICREKLMPDEHNCITLLNALYTLCAANNLSATVPYFDVAYFISFYINSSTEAYADMQRNLALLSKSYGNMTYVVPLLECAAKIYEGKNQYKYALCLENTGDAYMVQKNIAEKREAALQVYTRYNEIAITLCKEEPEIADYQYIQCLSNFKLGEVYQKSGDIEQAVVQFNLCIKRAELLCEFFPDNIDYRHIVSGTYSKIGEVLLKDNKPEEAEKLYTIFFETQKLLAEKNPNDVNSQKFLSIAYLKLGELWESRKDLPKAAGFFDKYRDMNEKLFEKNKEDIQHQYSLAVAYSRLANVMEGDNKVRFLKQAKAFSDAILEKMPENTDYLSTARWIYNEFEKLGISTPAT
ncbi:MAG: toll/interleukin-1 receptor domain-containing protein [Bacteroidetes bacterium]|nr:toll/interleukin-1 receptor domain-containing protein [Bacteroidota bacterium]